MAGIFSLEISLDIIVLKRVGCTSDFRWLFNSTLLSLTYCQSEDNGQIRHVDRQHPAYYCHRIPLIVTEEATLRDILKFSIPFNRTANARMAIRRLHLCSFLIRLRLVLTDTNGAPPSEPHQLSPPKCIPCNRPIHEDWRKLPIQGGFILS